ncbi:hypothetical protein D1AOALGA4SA_7288 [Olavius algarvensis Delta 1 endosymbiont]|nr:hypothetical protein D1AOALGA4SA_7288 [Olavius algarvensis Delta 1 endosymbiont]
MINKIKKLLATLENLTAGVKQVRKTAFKKTRPAERLI